VITTKTEETYQAIGQLLDRGTRLSDAVRRIAGETGRSEAAVRANYYNQRTKLGFKEARAVTAAPSRRRTRSRRRSAF